MKYTVLASPYVEFWITPGDVRDLKQASEMHYDSLCKSYSMRRPEAPTNGLIAIWEMSFECYDQGGDDVGGISVKCTVTQLDVLAKITEPIALVGFSSDVQHRLMRWHMRFAHMMGACDGTRKDWLCEMEVR